ncbi:hypothetical protein JOC74_002229 [Bacillus capparidis]|uniref:Uncharacterized protein n=1 Tax=Bacillus capparidis TaxID=1840411 RepID=A0ABS4CW27_9BACI|nr:hypothetical protein [Bacillus capparidis]
MSQEFYMVLLPKENSSSEVVTKKAVGLEKKERI